MSPMMRVTARNTTAPTACHAAGAAIVGAKLAWPPKTVAEARHADERSAALDSRLGLAPIARE